MRKQKVALLLLVVLTMGILTGCTGVEAEKRLYPQVLSIDEIDGVYEVILGLPDMKKATGQDKSSEGSNPNSLVYQGKSRDEILGKYNQTQEKYLDVSHVQVLILGENLCTGQKWKMVMEDLAENIAIGEDIYVLYAQNPSAVMACNGGKKGSLGEYIVGLYENRPMEEGIQGVTLREVFKVWYEKDRLLTLPLIETTQENDIWVEDMSAGLQKSPYVMAWWGTMYPQYCYSEIEYADEGEDVKLSFGFRWLQGF